MVHLPPLFSHIMNFLKHFLSHHTRPPQADLLHTPGRSASRHESPYCSKVGGLPFLFLSHFASLCWQRSCSCVERFRYNPHISERFTAALQFLPTLSLLGSAVLYAKSYIYGLSICCSINPLPPVCVCVCERDRERNRRTTPVISAHLKIMSTPSRSNSGTFSWDVSQWERDQRLWLSIGSDWVPQSNSGNFYCNLQIAMMESPRRGSADYISSVSMSTFHIRYLFVLGEP